MIEISQALYDNALVHKIKHWTEGTQVQVLSPDETKRLFELITDKNNDKPIQLPIICLRRKPGYDIQNISKRPASYDGVIVDSSSTQVQQLDQIPIALSYQLDVYTKFYDEADAYMREIIFNLINSPIVDIVVPYYDTNVVQRSAVELGTRVEDLSSIPERLIPGQFTRLSVEFTIPDAHLFDVRQKQYKGFDFSAYGSLLIASSDEDIVEEKINLNN